MKEYNALPIHVKPLFVFLDTSSLYAILLSMSVGKIAKRLGQYKSVWVTHQVHAHIRNHGKLGETFDQVLRRLLGLAGKQKNGHAK